MLSQVAIKEAYEVDWNHENSKAAMEYMRNMFRGGEYGQPNNLALRKDNVGGRMQKCCSVALQKVFQSQHLLKEDHA